MNLMEATSVSKLPRGAQWQYEPKWDGFRCLLIRDGSQLSMQSKGGRDLVRYFPEVASGALKLSKTAFILDGEIIIETKNGYAFDSLLQRIHSAASRIKRLASETPATFIVFDILRLESTDLTALPLLKRRASLEAFAKAQFKPAGVFRLSPASRNFGDAETWLKTVGEDHDGVVAKRLDLAYRASLRDGVQKIKCVRTADCVIGGFRYAENKQSRRKVVGSLLLGLYDEAGLHHHVGFSSGIKPSDRIDLTDRLEKIKSSGSFTGKAPGGPSRWSTRRSGEWQAVRPLYVVEVSFDQISNDRFRHGTRLIRWRPDKKAAQCRMDQLKQMAGRRKRPNRSGQYYPSQKGEAGIYTLPLHLVIDGRKMTPAFCGALAKSRHLRRTR